MKTTTRRVIVTSYAHGRAIAPGDFEIADHALGDLRDGQVRLQTLALSVDPALRVQLTGLEGFVPNLPLGSPIYSLGIARVLESRTAGVQAGEIVSGVLEWADESIWLPLDQHPLGADLLTQVHPLGARLEKVDAGGHPPSQVLGALGVNGLTAYFGIVHVADPRPDDVVLVSGAAGGVGSLAGQIARLCGARVIGLAGAEWKRRALIDDLGYHAALDYRSDGFADGLLEVMPTGPDIYFDNVGGEVSNRIMWHMRHRSKIVECGQISTYDEQGGGWRVDIRPIHANGLRFESFTPFHFQQLIPGARAQLAHWLQTGELTALETRLAGLDTAPSALQRLFAGENLGKMIIEVDE